MELNVSKEKKRKKQKTRQNDHEVIQYDHSIPISRENLRFVDRRKEAATIQRVFSLFKYQKENKIRQLPINTVDNEELKEDWLTEMCHRILYEEFNQNQCKSAFTMVPGKNADLTMNEFVNIINNVHTHVPQKQSIPSTLLKKLQDDITRNKSLLDELGTSSEDVAHMITALRLCVPPNYAKELFKPIKKFQQATQLRQIVTPKKAIVQKSSGKMLKVELGNAVHLNENLRRFYFVAGDKKDQHSIFHAVSLLLYNNSDYAALLQLATFCEMAEDEAFLRKKENASALTNVLKNDSIPHKSTCCYLEKVIDKNILLHEGCFPPSNFSVRFGKRSDQKSVNLCVKDWLVHPLYPDEFMIRQTWSYQPKDFRFIKDSKQEAFSNPLQKEFPAILHFYSRCEFCIEYERSTCHHIFPSHFRAKEDIMNQLRTVKYGHLLSTDVKYHEDLTRQLPSELANFVCVEVPGDGSCQFHSVGFAITGSVEFTHTLRRLLATEFIEHAEFYTTSFLDMKHSQATIQKTRRICLSTTAWGNSETLLLLSRITSRRILVFTVECKTDPNIHNTVSFVKLKRMYEFGEPASANYPPIYLVQDNQNRNKPHFRPIFPRTSQHHVSCDSDREYRTLITNAKKYFLAKENSPKVSTSGDSSTSSFIQLQPSLKNQQQTIEKKVITAQVATQSIYDKRDAGTINPDQVTPVPRCIVITEDEKEIDIEGENVVTAGLTINLKKESISSSDEIKDSSQLTKEMHTSTAPYQSDRLESGQILEDVGINVTLDKEDIDQSNVTTELDNSPIQAAPNTVSCGIGESLNNQHMQLKETREEISLGHKHPIEITETGEANIPSSCPAPSSTRSLSSSASYANPEQKNSKGKAVQFDNSVEANKNVLFIYNGAEVSVTDLEIKDDNILHKLGLHERLEKCDKEKYIWFLNSLRQDIKILQCKHSIDAYLNNSSLPKFWREKISKFDKSKKQQVTKNMSKYLVGIQEKELARQVVVEFFEKVKMPNELVSYYKKEAQKVFNEKRESRKGGRPNVAEKSRLDGDTGPSRKKKKTEIPFIQCQQCDPWINLNQPEVKNKLEEQKTDQSDSDSHIRVSTFQDIPTQGEKGSPDTYIVDDALSTNKNSINFIAVNNDIENHDNILLETEIISDKESEDYFSGRETTSALGIDNDDNFFSGKETTSDIDYDPNEDLLLESDKKLRNEKDDGIVPQIPQVPDQRIGIPISPNSDSGSTKEDKSEFNLETKAVKEIAKLVKAFPEFNTDILNYSPEKKFDFEIPWEKLKDIYDFETSTFLKGEWADTVSDYFTDKQKVCSFIANRSPQYNQPDGRSNFCILKGHCPCEMQFTITIPHPPVRRENLVCHVETIGTFQLIQSRVTGRKLTGGKREKLSKTLLHEKAGKVYLKNIKSNTLLRFLHNNNIQMSISVLQKLRHEAKHALANSPDVFEDIVLFCAESEQLEKGDIVRGFIQEQCFREGEINVKMYTESSLRLLLTCHSETDMVLHFDATGSVIIDKYGKKMLYYLAHVRTNKGYTFPLASMISQSGKAVDIARLFQLVKRDIKKIKPSFNKPLVSVAVSDFSFAAMTALCNGLNTQTMKDYIRSAYPILLGKEVMEKDRSVIFVCNSHILKSYSRLLSKHIKTKKIITLDTPVDIRQLAVHSFAKMISSRDLMQFARSSFAFCELFCSKTITDEKREKYLSFLTNHDVLEEFEESKIDDFDFESIFPSQEHFELRERSQFYHLFKSIREKAHQSSSDSMVDNEAYNPLVVDLIERYYIQYAPFYCSMILYSTNRSSEERYSNSAVESKFKFVKNIHLNHDRYALNIFIRLMYEYHVGEALEVIATAARSGKERNQRKKVNAQLQEEDSEEVWCKRKQKKRTPKYMNPKVQHKPENVILHSDLATASKEYVDLNFESIKKPLENLTPSPEKKNQNSKLKSKLVKNKISGLPSDIHEIYDTVIKSALAVNEVRSDSDRYESPNDGELQKSLKEHRENMQKRADSQKSTKRTEMFHGSLFIMDKPPNDDVVDRLDKEMEMYLEDLVEIDDKLRYCEKVLATLPSDEKNPNALPKPPEQKTRSKSPKLKLKPSFFTEKSSAIDNTPSKCSTSRAPAYSFVSTILADCDGFTLNSEQILNLANQDEWIETEIIDFYMRYLKCNRQIKDEITITPSAYVYLTNREKNEWVNARQAEIPWADSLILFDVQQQQKHLHPLLLNNHFILLELDRTTKKCTVYDSFKNEREQNQPGILEDDKKLIQNHVLPDFFMYKDAISEWKVEHFTNMPQQTDHINCGIFVMSAAYDIINGQSSDINPPKSMGDQRMNIIREILVTTENGRRILNQAGQDDRLLKSLIKHDATKAKNAKKEFYEKREKEKLREKNKT